MTALAPASGVAWGRALVLGAAALAAAAPHASWSVAAAAACTAIAGGAAGDRLAATRLRSWVVASAGAIFLAAAAVLTALAGRTTLVARLLGPEPAAEVMDAGIVATLAAVAALIVGLAARRVPGGGVLPAVLLVLAITALLAPHRGGAINRPLEVGDLAWLRGWHPAFVLGLTGVAASVFAVLALARPSGFWRTVALMMAVVALALGLLAVYPAFGVFSFSDVDPLWLAGPPGEDRGTLPGRGDRRVARGSSQTRPDGDSLGLGRGQGEGTEPVPFLDEYPSGGSQVPVAVVVLHDDIEPANGVFYFRQVAFSRWNGRRLVRSFEADADRDLFAFFPASGVVEKPAPPGADARALVHATVSLLRDHAQPFVMTDGLSVAPAENPDPSLFRRTYRTSSSVLVDSQAALFGSVAGSPAWSEDLREIYLEMPSDPRYGALAAEILATLREDLRDDPWARALAVGIWIERNTLYSTRSQHAGAPDPTASYLFGSRIGYCVHVAHAATFLMRALGLPARVSAGYAYEAAQRGQGSAILLRSGDAHAWAEVHLEGVGWVPIDPGPTPIDPPLPAPDMDLQALLGELARGDETRLARDMPSAWRLPTARELLLAIALALALWAGTGYAVKSWRALARLLIASDGSARLSYRAALDRLAEIGLTREHGETREAFAARAAALTPAFLELTRLHLGARWGGHEAPQAASRALASRVGRELRERMGRRALLGALDPWRFLRAR